MLKTFVLVRPGDVAIQAVGSSIHKPIPSDSTFSKSEKRLTIAQRRKMLAERLLVTHEPRSCLGWQCLTPAEHFGIIFSSAIFLVVFSIAYMYYLGKARINHLRQTSGRLPPTQRHSHNHTMMTAPGMWHMQNHQPALFYQPAMCNNVTYMVPVMQPIATNERYGQPQYARLGQMATAQQAHPNIRALNSPEVSPRGVHHAASTYRSSMSSVDPEHQHSTWRQRLQQVFRMPTGRASTIASSSAPTTPSRGNSRASKPVSARKHTSPVDRCQGGPQNLVSQTVPYAQPFVVPARAQLRPSPETTSDAGECEDTMSVHTDCATVHSDDFQLNVQPPSPNVVPAGLQSQSSLDLNKHTVDKTQNPEFGKGVCPDLYSIPSTSSVQMQEPLVSLEARLKPTKLSNDRTTSRIAGNSALDTVTELDGKVLPIS